MASIAMRKMARLSDRALRTPASFAVLLVLWCPALAQLPGFDLGGPCQDVNGLSVLRELEAAKKTGDWDRAVELEKLQVRAGCRIQYRWFSLADALVHARREQEAVAVLQEIDTRFGLQPMFRGGVPTDGATFDGLPGDVGHFMESAVFRASAIGKKVEALKSVSDARRAEFSARLQAMPTSQRPPDNYVAKGACPFECCSYRQWTVLQRYAVGRGARQ